MGRMKDLAISLRNGDELSQSERNYVSTLSQQEYDQYRAKADYSFDTYQDYRYWLEQEAKKREKSLPSQQENQQQSSPNNKADHE